MTELTFGAQAAPFADPSIVGRWWRTVDRWTLGAVLALFVIGVLLSFAASPPLAEKNDKALLYYVYRHVFFGSLSVAAMLVVSMLPPVLLRRWATLGFGVCFLLILLLPVFGTDFGKGATRWYSLGFASLQPSEFLKPFFAVFAGWLMAGSFARGGPPGIAISFVFATCLAALLALQPDFGQALLLMTVWGVMYFVAGASIPLLVGAFGFVGAAGAYAYTRSEHLAGRINAFLSADLDPRTQIGYATTAILEGGLFGVGAGEGSVKWSLPDAHTDFIIAVAAEEYGLLFCLLIVALFLFVTCRSLWLLTRERDPFARFAGAGLAALFGLQALVNLGVAIRLFPSKGMTLPFVSYGGSSMLAVGIGIGMLLAFTRRRPQEDVTDILDRARRAPRPL